jgi:uridine kinase
MTGTRAIDAFEALAAENLHNYGKGRAIVAIDGFAGTAEFGDRLADAVKLTGHPVFRASIRNFRQPPVTRYAGGSVALERAIDIDTLRRVLIDPFRDGGTGSFVLAAFDPDREAPIPQKWRTAKPDSLLIIDGELLQDSELRGLWIFTVWLESAVDPSTEQAQYLTKLKPSATASAIVDNADPAHPRRLFVDSC